MFIDGKAHRHAVEMRGHVVNLPKIDLDTLPGLDIVQGLFGSLSDLATASVDDRIVVLMVYIYEMHPPVS